MNSQDLDDAINRSLVGSVATDEPGGRVKGGAESLHAQALDSGEDVASEEDNPPSAIGLEEAGELPGARIGLVENLLRRKALP